MKSFPGKPCWFSKAAGALGAYQVRLDLARAALRTPGLVGARALRRLGEPARFARELFIDGFL